MGIKKGFTLIEMIVVIAVIALTLPSIFAIVFGIAKQQTKIYRIFKVKQEGDYILNLVTDTVRNSAVGIYSSSPPNPPANEKCQSSPYPSTYTSATSLVFQDRISKWFSISLSGNNIASASALGTNNLNSSKVTISNFTIKCRKKNVYSNAEVTLLFRISYNASSTLPEDTAYLDYQTRIMLRN